MTSNFKGEKMKQIPSVLDMISPKEIEYLKSQVHEAINYQPDEDKDDDVKLEQMTQLEVENLLLNEDPVKPKYNITYKGISLLRNKPLERAYDYRSAIWAFYGKVVAHHIDKEPNGRLRLRHKQVKKRLQKEYDPEGIQICINNGIDSYEKLNCQSDLSQKIIDLQSSPIKNYDYSRKEEAA